MNTQPSERPAMRGVLQLYLSPAGRIDRATWWRFCMLPALVVSWLVALADRLLGVGGILLGIWYAAILWPMVALTIKRWHDRDKSGWWLMVLLIPVLGSLWNFVVCGFLSGTAGPNRFGPPAERS